MADAARRTGFFPVVAAGLLMAALTSIASAKPWFRAALGSDLAPGVPASDRSADMPLALALSLVVLAGWGAMLVSRGRVRRAVLVVGLLAALGVLACLVAAPFTLPGDIRDRLLPGSGHVDVSLTGWYLTAAAAALLSAASLVAAWVLLPRWPTMSSRYDAPGAGAASAEAAPRTDTELWKALDEGLDPTDPGDGRGPGSP